MKSIMLGILILCLFGCDLGSKAGKRVVDKADDPITGGDNLEKDTPKAKTFFESEESKLLKNKMITDVNDFESRLPVVGEKIEFYKTFFEPVQVMFTIELDDDSAPEDSFVCLYQTIEHLVTEEVTAISNGGRRFDLKITTRPNLEKTTYAGPETDEEKVEQCNEELENQITILEEKNINTAQRVAKHRTEFNEELEFIRKACFEGGTFSAGECSGYTTETEIKSYEISGTEYPIFMTKHIYEGTSGTVVHTWGVCNYTPYFSIGFNCFIGDNDPLFEAGKLHPLLCLGVTAYTRPDSDED